MTLFIDTTDFNRVTYAFSNEGKIKKQAYKIDPHKSHETLAKLEEFLNKSKILHPESRFKKIIVNKGPGSYTGVRIGVTHAQALGFAWGIPIKFVAADKFVIK